MAILNGDNGNNTIDGFDDQDDIISGFDGNDRLNGKAGNDKLDGGDGDDDIYGGEDDDTITGGRGDDTLYGGAYSSYGYGNDTFIYNKGDGADVIYDNYGVSDKVEFKGLKSTDISRVGMDQYGRAYIYLNDGGSVYVGSITDTSNSVDTGIESFKFDDKTLNQSNLQKLEITTNQTNGNDIIRGFDVSNDIITGLAGNDEIYGYKGNDTLDGGEGNDSIYGGKGNDKIIGGRGNDKLHGGDNYYQGYGSDVFIYNKGDGVDEIYDNYGVSDRIEFKGLVSTNIARVGIDSSSKATIYLNDGGSVYVGSIVDTVDSTETGIESFKFDDKSINQSVLRTLAITTNQTNGNDIIRGYDESNDKISGLTGNDTINGWNGNDTLDGGDGNDIIYGGEYGNDIITGGKGNDTLYGGDNYYYGYGNDTFIYNKGDGVDIIYDNYGVVDKLQLDGLISTDISGVTVNSSQEATIKFKDGGSIYVGRIDDNSNDTRTGLESFEFDDKTLKQADLRSLAISSNQTNGNDVIYGFRRADVISSGLGNDTIYSYAGDDTVDGGDGDDYIVGGSGKDILIGGKGNDRIYAEDGNDTITGGEGKDELYGYAGNDLFKFLVGDSKNLTKDYVGGFETGVDKLDLSFANNLSDFAVTVSGNVSTLTYAHADFVLQVQGSFNLATDVIV